MNLKLKEVSAFRFLTIAVFASFVALAPISCMAESSLQAESRAEVVALARAGNIALVEAAVQKAQAEFERNQSDDRRLAGLIDGIGDNRLPFYDIETQLDQWVERSPQSYAARLMRGHFLGAEAGRARGFAWARSTTPAQFAKMRQLFQRSHDDLLIAIRLTAVPLHARIRLMWNSLVGSQRDVFREQYELAVAKSPGSLPLRVAYMASLEPRWGGTFEEMTRYAGDSANALKPAEAAELRSAALADEASMFNSSKNYAAAEKKFQDAAQIADTPGIRCGYAQALAGLGRFQEAIANLQAAFENPDFQWSCAGYVIAQIEHKNPQLDGIGELLDRALERHPDHVEMLKSRGYRLQQRGEPLRAYRDFRAAAETGDSWSETMVGKYLFNGAGGVTLDRDEGMTWLKRAAAKGERNAQLSVTQALATMGRQGEIAAVQAEYQKVNRLLDEQENSLKAQEATSDPLQLLRHRALALWEEYRLYLALGLAAGLVAMRRK